MAGRKSDVQTCYSHEHELRKMAGSRLFADPTSLCTIRALVSNWARRTTGSLQEVSLLLGHKGRWRGAWTMAHRPYAMPAATQHPSSLEHSANANFVHGAMLTSCSQTATAASYNRQNRSARRFLLSSSAAAGPRCALLGRLGV